MLDWVTDDQILPLSLEHNFWTWSAQAKVKPIPVKRAKGVYFWDMQRQALPGFQLDDHVRQHRARRRTGDRGHRRAGARAAFRRTGHGHPPARRAGTSCWRDHSRQGFDPFLLHPGRGGRQRERHQAGARVHRAASRS